jgi:hypothetical protein
MSTTLDLINAIETQDATAIEGAFNAAMAERVSSKLEDMRMSVAQNMFKTPAADVAEIEEEPDSV